jgi:PPM family protein phosphatase
MESLFPSGTLEITPGASAAIAAVGADPSVFFARHQSGDWGEEDEEIQQENAFVLQQQQAIFSIYRLSDDTLIRVMTTADRSVTRMSLAAEYPYREVSTRKGYELWAASYDQPNNPLIIVEEPMVDEIVADLAISSALDVGTGTGRYALKLARRGIAVTAIDQSPEMLAVARQAASVEGLSIDFQLASLDNGLSFASGSFDFLICALMLCHVANLVQAIQEFSRVLQDDSYLLITDFHPDSVDHGWRTDFRWEGKKYRIPNMPHSRADYLEAITAAGFTVLRVIDIPLRATPEGFLPEAIMRDRSEQLLCLIILAQKNIQLNKISFRTSPSARSTSSSGSPFTFAAHSNAHEEHPARNEDTILVDRRRGLAAVFDGVGGEDAGDVASQLGARVICRAWKRIVQQQYPNHNAALLMLRDDLDIQMLLHQLLDEAQSAISDEGERRAKAAPTPQEKISYPETTVVVSAFCQCPDKKGYIMGFAHVGDSRIYLLRPSEPLQSLTRDDGYFTLKIKDHTISEEDALRIDQTTHADALSETEREIFDKRNGITQSLGHLNPKQTSITIHTTQTMIFPGDRVLLCSDGIHDNLTDAEIEAIVRGRARTTVARYLVQRALDRSREECLRAKKDDMSAVVITCNF